MYNYYCKNCNNLIGEWNDKYEYYDILNFCCNTESKNINLIDFLDCINCNKFVGIECWYVCENCFGEDEIVGEKNLFNWFLKYKKIINHNYYNINCKICDCKNFRNQYWFFKELTFYKE